MQFDTLYKFKNSKYIFVVGIGGSNLASKAVWIATSLHNPFLNKKVFFIESLSESQRQEIMHIAKNEVGLPEDICIFVISKSGETRETLISFSGLISIFENILGINVFERVVCISEDGSRLFVESQKEGALCLPWQQQVGGRWSAFTIAHTAVLFVLGLDINSYLSGEREMTEVCREKGYDKGLAQTIFENYNQGRNVLDFFFFDERLETLGKWLRQLFAESLGKQGITGERVGLLPTVSLGPTDLHSMLQLYLGGTKNRFTIFVKNESEQGFDYHSALETEKAYEKSDLPFTDYKLSGVNEKEIAKFMRFFMNVVLELATLFKVDPYGQPEVEKYKEQIKNKS